MLDIYGFKIAKTIALLAEVKWFWAMLDQKGVIGDPSTGFQKISRTGVEGATKAAIKSVREVCELIDLKRIEPELGRLEQLVWPPYPGMPATGGNGIATAIAHLTSRLQDELNEKHFVCPVEQDVQHYGQKELFGEAVARKFRHAAKDIQEAGNCLAVAQPTASVFHSMRAMEVAVRQLSKRLNVTITPQTTWRQMTGLMDHKIKVLPEATDRQKRKKNDWEAARANLHHVGSVWRNNTMHPATSYTQAQARDVLSAVRVFMNALCAL